MFSCQFWEWSHCWGEHIRLPHVCKSKSRTMDGSAESQFNTDELGVSVTCVSLCLHRASDQLITLGDVSDLQTPECSSFQRGKRSGRGRGSKKKKKKVKQRSTSWSVWINEGTWGTCSFLHQLVWWHRTTDETDRRRLWEDPWDVWRCAESHWWKQKKRRCWWIGLGIYAAGSLEFCHWGWFSFVSSCTLLQLKKVENLFIYF